MGIFDAIFDELGKNIKDAPGWLPLLILCQALFWLFPSLTTPFDNLGLEVEKSTLATLIAVTSYFAGDVLDAVFFPRERDEKRAEKIFNTSMLLIGAVAVFLMLAKGFLVGLLIGAVWCVALPLLFWAVLVPRQIKTEAGQARAPEKVHKCREDETGFRSWVPFYNHLKIARDDACTNLRIDRRIYRVSMSLTRKTGEDTIWDRFWIRFWNAAAKFLRSAVFGVFVIGAYLGFVQRAFGPAVGLVVLAILLVPISFYLKALHMWMLYELAAKTVKENGDKYQCECLNENDSICVFLWDSDLVDCFSTKS